MKLISSVAGVAMALILPLCGTAIAQEFSSPEGRPPRNAPMQLLKQLNLTTAQKQQIKAIQERDKESRRSAMAQLRAGERELRNMLDGASSDDMIRQKFNQVQTLRQQNMKMHFEQMLAIREVLTPQQRSQLTQILKNAQGKIRERFQKPMPPES